MHKAELSDSVLINSVKSVLSGGDIWTRFVKYGVCLSSMAELAINWKLSWNLLEMVYLAKSTRQTPNLLPSRQVTD